MHYDWKAAPDTYFHCDSTLYQLVWLRRLFIFGAVAGNERDTNPGVALNIDQYWNPLEQIPVCRNANRVSSKMLSSGGTVLRALSSLQGAKTAVTLFAKRNQQANVSESEVGC